MRVVSLVPSTTETVASLGRSDWLVGVTRYCTVGASDSVRRVGGTKNPALDDIVALEPDVVLVNTEENRPPDIEWLRQAGLHVAESLPKTVEAARDVIVEIGGLLDAADAAAAIAADIDAALAEATETAPPQRLVALTLIWRRPWMAVGPDTYADDLLWRCGFANALSGYDERYPKIEQGLMLGADVVLLPSEPYEFTDDDLPSVAQLVPDTPAHLVDGELLTWHGPRTARGLRHFTTLARDLSAGARTT